MPVGNQSGVVTLHGPLTSPRSSRVSLRRPTRRGRPMHPSETEPDVTGTTRRSFIRGVARTGASTVAAAGVLKATGVPDLLADAEAVPGGRTEFSRFRAI